MHADHAKLGIAGQYAIACLQNCFLRRVASFVTQIPMWVLRVVGPRRIGWIRRAPSDVRFGNMRHECLPALGDLLVNRGELGIIGHDELAVGILISIPIFFQILTASASWAKFSSSCLMVSRWKESSLNL